MDKEKIIEFGKKYTAAWCSQKPDNVASFFAENGSLKVNEGDPAIGSAAISEVAQSFMTAFPDLIISMDDVDVKDTQFIYRWTLDGTNNGPDGTGKRVHISGFEEWTFGSDDLIAESKGHFDEAEYSRQLEHGYTEKN